MHGCLGLPQNIAYCIYCFKCSSYVELKLSFCLLNALYQRKTVQCIMYAIIALTAIENICPVVRRQRIQILSMPQLIRDRESETTKLAIQSGQERHVLTPLSITVTLDKYMGSCMQKRVVSILQRTGELLKKTCIQIGC